MMKSKDPHPDPLPAYRESGPEWVERPARRRLLAQRLSLMLLWLLVFVAAIPLGFALRDWTWRVTAPIRFQYDISNAIRIGHVVNDDAVAIARTRDPTFVSVGPATPLPIASWRDTWAAYCAQYDRVYASVIAKLGDRKIQDIAYEFDYPPARLLIVTAWLRAIRIDPAMTDPQDASHRGYSDAAAWPMRRVNEAHELLAAVGTFAFVRRVLRDSGRTPRRALTLATFAALLMWFNPALILEAHGWPQWDVWVLPYTIWALFFGLKDRWAIAGALLAIGAMFKGQVLMIAPMFALWPLFRTDVDAVARLTTGFLFAAAICLSPWLLATAEARVWMAGVIVVIALLTTLSGRRVPARATLAWAAAAGVMAAWLITPFAVRDGVARWPTMALLAAFAIGASGVWRGRLRVIALATIALAAFIAPGRFGGSFAWLHVGFQTSRWPMMTIGQVMNLPAVLHLTWQWVVESPVSLGGVSDKVELRTLLRSLAMLGLALIAIAMARLSRRGRAIDANLLIAFPAAWLMLYALLPQMHERYLVWAAATSAMLAARSFGGLLAYLFLSAVQVEVLLLQMVVLTPLKDDAAWVAWIRAGQGLFPWMGYAVAMLACVLVVWAFTRERATHGPHRRDPLRPRRAAGPIALPSARGDTCES